MNSIKYLFSTILLVMSLILTISLDLPVYAFICLYIILIVLSAVIGNSLPIFKYYDRCETVELMEMVYNNDYKNYKQKTFLALISWIVFFALYLFIVILNDSSNSSTSETIFFIIMTIGSGLGALCCIIFYMRVARSKQIIPEIILNEKRQKFYPLYKAERDTRSYEEIYEEMLLPRPQYYQAVNTANKIAAIIFIIMGLLILAFLYSYRNDTNTDVFFSSFVFLFGILSIYWGIIDILKTSTTQEQKITFPLLSCLLAALLYTPTSHQLNKLFLEEYVHNIKRYNYNSSTNVFQDTIKVQNIADEAYIYQKHSLPLYYYDPYMKTLLKKIIRAGAEYQSVYMDTIGNKQIVSFSLNELKDVYNKSNLELRIEFLKLTVDESTVYDDGKYIVIEMNRDKNIPPPYTTPSEQNDFLTWLTNYTKRSADINKIASFNRGLRIRYIFNNNQFVESAVSLNELRNKGKQKKTDTPQKSKSFFKRFSKQPDN